MSNPESNSRFCKCLNLDRRVTKLETMHIDSEPVPDIVNDEPVTRYTAVTKTMLDKEFLKPEYDHKPVIIQLTQCWQADKILVNDAYLVSKTIGFNSMSEVANYVKGYTVAIIHAYPNKDGTLLSVYGRKIIDRYSLRIYSRDR